MHTIGERGRPPRLGNFHFEIPLSLVSSKICTSLASVDTIELSRLIKLTQTQLRWATDLASILRECAAMNRAILALLIIAPADRAVHVPTQSVILVDIPILVLVHGLRRADFRIKNTAQIQTEILNILNV